MIVRFAAYNICFGGTDRLEPIARVLAQIAPDVAALTEPERVWRPTCADAQ